MANIIRAASRRDVLKISALSAAGGMLGAGARPCGAEDA